jgi:hypothetical protein
VEARPDEQSGDQENARNHNTRKNLQYWHDSLQKFRCRAFSARQSFRESDEEADMEQITIRTLRRILDTSPDTSGRNATTASPSRHDNHSDAPAE